MTVRGDDGPPTLESAARQLGVSVADIDPEFGVVLIDPTRGLYSVQVDGDSIADRTGGSEEPYQGPFSNPRIASFGPGTDEPEK
jgi:hypothetical protein